MDTSEYSSKISALVQDCEDYRDERSKDRLAAMEFYDGNPDAIPYEDGRSKVVSRDVRASIKKVLPSIVRTLFGNEKIVEYQPRGPGDEQGAEQATDYINAVVLPEGGGTKVLIDAVYDALKLRNGVLRWWADERTEIDVSTHTGLTEMAFAQLVSEPDIEVLEQCLHPVHGFIVLVDGVGTRLDWAHAVPIVQRVEQLQVPHIAGERARVHLPPHLVLA